MHTYQLIDELGKYNQDNPLEKVNKVSYLGYNYNNNKFYYFNDNKNKVFINFFNIESVCNKCHQSFSSKLAFHKHLKRRCFFLTSRQLTKLSCTK